MSQPKAPQTDLALSIENVTKIYGSGLRAVDDLSFSISAGEIFGLLGPNGAGKSTLIGMICGLVRITSGKISVFGADVQSQYQVTRSRIGVTPQEIAIDNFFRVGEALQIHSGYFGRKDDPAWRERLIERLDLGPHLHKKPLELSGGMKRRLLIAKSLVHRPKVLILDEPTAGVDVELRRSLWAFVRELRDEGMTILLTTHYLEEAQSLCDRLAIINGGKMVAYDKTSNIMNQFGKGTDARLEDIYVELTKKGGGRV
ncbi:MAG TPA: ABC transporter ATP-binding protein [Bdellovibrionota bacterium]|jgi:ABC-2 type transport system ATP-binding protein|nr:ABC transporter ATP-binding protein [Bdellovibrionota bacterium]